MLLLAPAAALLAAAVAREPLLAHWTQTFMGSAAQILDAVLSAVSARRPVRQAHGGQRLGVRHCRLYDRASGRSAAPCWRSCSPAPLVTYGGVSLFVAFFVLAPMAHALFRAAAIPRRLDAGGDRARHIDLHYVGAAGNAGDPERDPDAVLRHHAVRGAWPRHHRLAHHAGLRPLVARARRGVARARTARAMGRHADVAVERSRRIKSSASAQRPRAHSIRRRFAMDIKATPRRPSRSLLCRSPSWLVSIS